MAQKILVVDDEESLCEILKFNLEKEGFAVDVAYSAEQCQTMDLNVYSLIILDVMMGEMSGFTFAHQLKSKPETAIIPIIFCTAKNTEDDTILGLNLGADDYIQKPFSVREVVARVQTVLRRAVRQKEDSVKSSSLLSYETLQVDINKKRVTLDGEDVQLTKKEFEILVLLLSNKGVILSRTHILDHVWSDEVVVLDRTIDVNITRLRKKIGRYGSHIITKMGYGYGFEE
ncbi:MAG: response regulator transcription factor [Paludibacteraceae bacterium]|jgi:two-component system phosphate regulon response regulator PhoB|nr:response regulator transcription factor [Paludibacteraceae bacterium]HOI26448.1 response regulator transcription factor [Paludibacteraceae bacterium]HOU67336.1 response regulator transcription factor [Paludibacteraceae bacterium]HPH62351.1 response regulator transcription factor [Paludibacteraceae bacterium]HQF50672.1 response regulator transcription factor [Paludibacteraceae bacterium]